MANTTDIMISCMEPELIPELCERSGIELFQVSDPEKCSGVKIVSFESFAGSFRCIGLDAINKLIAEFHKTQFNFPELAVLLISDDNDNASCSILHGRFEDDAIMPSESNALVQGQREAPKPLERSGKGVPCNQLLGNERS